MDIVQGTLPDSRTTLHYYLDIAASVRTFTQNCEVICGLSKVRSSHLEVFSKKGVLKNFAKFTREHLCRSLFFNKYWMPEI